LASDEEVAQKVEVGEFSFDQGPPHARSKTGHRRTAAHRAGQ